MSAPRQRLHRLRVDRQEADETGDVEVYRVGLVSLSCCAPASMPLDDVTDSVNRSHFTGISSQWGFAADEKTFATGEPNPCACERDPDRRHYLFHC